MEFGLNREKPRPPKIEDAIRMGDKKMLSDAGKLGALKANENRQKKRDEQEAFAEVSEEHKRELAELEELHRRQETGEDILPPDPEDQKEE